MFKVGQEVWDMRYGKGIISDIRENLTYPIYVKFESKKVESYMEKGQNWEGDLFPSLFPYPVKIVPADTPDYPFMLEGKAIIEGDKLDYLTDNKEKLSGIVEGLMISRSKKWVIFKNRMFRIALSQCSWPAPEPPKRWAYLIAGMPGPMSIGFTDPMTETEAREKYGQVWEVPEGEK